MAPKIYIHHANESLLENLFNRRSRPYTTYKKELLPVVMEHIKHSHPHLHDRLKNATWSWDKFCGCSGCPCSPAAVGLAGRQPWGGSPASYARRVREMERTVRDSELLAAVQQAYKAKLDHDAGCVDTVFKVGGPGAAADQGAE